MKNAEAIGGKGLDQNHFGWKSEGYFNVCKLYFGYIAFELHLLGKVDLIYFTLQPVIGLVSLTFF